VTFDITELSVCVVCIHLLANGEYDDGTDAAEVASAGQLAKWGDDVQHLVAGGDDLGFMKSDCDGCGDHHHGDRFRAYLMIPTGAPSSCGCEPVGSGCALCRPEQWS